VTTAAVTAAFGENRNDLVCEIDGARVLEILHGYGKARFRTGFEANGENCFAALEGNDHTVGGLDNSRGLGGIGDAVGDVTRVVVGHQNLMPGVGAVEDQFAVFEGEAGWGFEMERCGMGGQCE
jgi:hypothetical protein